MARPPMNSAPMTRIVKFRLTDAELAMLNEIRDESESLSPLLRSLIHAEYKRYRRRK